MNEMEYIISYGAGETHYYTGGDNWLPDRKKAKICTAELANKVIENELNWFPGYNIMVEPV